MLEVSSLTAVFANKVQAQAETIDEVVTHTEQATLDVQEGGKQLHEALQGGARSVGLCSSFYLQLAWYCLCWIALHRCSTQRKLRRG